MKVIELKALKRLHDSGFRVIQIKGQDGKIITDGSDAIHLRLGGAAGTWINIDCKKDGTFRIFAFPSPEGPEFEPEEFPMSSCFIDIIGNIRVDNRKQNTDTDVASYKKTTRKLKITIQKK